MMHFEKWFRPGRRALALVAVALLASGMLAFGLLASGCGMRGDKTASGQQAPMYHCPMHPTYTSDKPGDCPICGMSLVLIHPSGDSSASADGASAGPRRILHYRNPMNAEVTSPVPAKDEMGMDYVPVYSDEVGASSGVEGHAIVELRPDELKLTGIQTAVARRGRLARTIRTVGEVKADETLVHHAHTKVSGWVEKLYVSFSGQQVRAGQPLLTIYSPELLATQEEYVRAMESAAQFEHSDVAEVRRGGQELLEAARRRLMLFDVPEKLIAELERTRQPQRAITLDAPQSGFVTSKDVSDGMQVEPGTTLFTVTDLSRVWIEAEVYEYEAAMVRVGQLARVTLPNAPGVVHSARISYVYPYLDTETRTLRVRFDFENPGQILKPGMYANVELDGDATDGVLVPDAAIMDTGVRQIVYVQTAPGHFEPRQVSVGSRTGDQARILSGVRAGESVVIQANFLLDSESRLRAAIAGAPKAKTGAGGSK
jgi:Cu(I)/Ag(I) efflux system membrane fusion protein